MTLGRAISFVERKVGFATSGSRASALLPPDSMLCRSAANHFSPVMPASRVLIKTEADWQAQV